MYYKYSLILIIGIVAGMIESSIGMSFLVIPLLLLFNVMPNFKRALGTMMCAFIFPLSIGAVFVHFKNKNVEIPSAIVLGISYFIGVTIASKFICNISNHKIMLYAGVALICFGLYYIYRSKQQHKN